MFLIAAMAAEQFLPMTAFGEDMDLEAQIAEETVYIEETEEMNADILSWEPETDTWEDPAFLIEEVDGYLEPDMEDITEAFDLEEGFEQFEEPASESIEEIEEIEEADSEAVDLLEEMAKEEISAAGETRDIATQIYFVEEPYSQKLTIPSGYAQQYQINTSGLQSPRFVTEAYKTVDISETGLVTVRAEIYYYRDGLWQTGYIEGAPTKIDYYSGETAIQVYDGKDLQFTVTVNCIDYRQSYYRDRKKEIEASIDTSGGQLQTFTNITKYVAENFDYDAHYSSGASMMAMGGGDCLASTDMIYDMAKDLGIDVRKRDAATDPLAGSGHMNVLAKIDGEYYVGDAGRDEEKPRSYRVTKEPGGLGIVGSRVHRYEGDAQILEIPARNGWDNVETIGCLPVTYGIFDGDGKNVTCIKLPATIKNIYPAALTGCRKLERIEVDPANTVYQSIDGVLYKKEEPTVVRVPQAITAYTIPDGITTIGNRAFRDCTKLKVLDIPSSVTKIEYRAFYGVSGCTITIPSSVTSIDSSAFEGYFGGRLIVEEGSYAAQFCSDNKLAAETYHVADNGEVILSHAWDKGKTTKEATCEEDGIITYTCKACKETKTEAIPSLGHETIEVAEIKPDCVNSGNIRHYSCSRCSQLFKDSAGKHKISKADTTLPALGHEMVETPYRAATCSEDGNDAYFTCSRCGKSYLDAQGKKETYPEICVNRATGHRMTWVPNEIADCTHDGHSAYYTCSTCNRIFLDYAGKKEASGEELVVPATGHSLTHYDWQEPTCSAPGHISYNYCSKCYKFFSDANGEHEISSESISLSPLGHDMEKVSYQAPSCSKYGQEEHFVCRRCNGVFTDKDGANRTTEWACRISQLPHDMEHVSYVPNSCEEDGVREHYRCNSCGGLFYDKEGFYKTTEDEIVLQAACHALRKEAYKAPTCRAEGNKEDWECISCGKLFSDEDQTSELNPEDIIIEKTSHSWSEDYVVITKPTRTREGCKAYRCTVCKTIMPGSQIPIPMLTDEDETDEDGAEGDEDDFSWAEDAARQIRPKGISKKITKLKAKVSSRKVKLTWKKLSAKQLKQYGITGIQVQVSTNKKFKTIYKEKKLAKTKTSWKFKGKAKKTYYIRARYYGKNVSSGWCKVIKVKIRK